MAAAATPPVEAAGSSGFGFMGAAPADAQTRLPAGTLGGDDNKSSGFGFMGSGADAGPPAPMSQAPDITSAFQALGGPSVGDSGLSAGVDAGGVSGSEFSSSAGASNSGVVVGGGAVEASRQLQVQEANLEILEQKCASIQTIVYQFEEMRTQFLNAKAELAQLNGNLESLQSQGIDTVVVQHLDPSSQEAIKADRKILVQRVAFLFDQISVTAEYMSKLTV